MLVLDDLSRHFGTKAAVSRVSLEIQRGSFVGVVGPSGAGKTTLLRLVNRLIEPTSGRITFDGLDVTALRGKELRSWRARTAMIFQQFNLIGRLDVLTNVLIGRITHVPCWRALLRAWPADDKALALTALEQFDIDNLAAQRAALLSGGQQQRVAIARALLQEPDIVLADEPIASLDVRNTRLVMDALLNINRLGITVICNLHSLDIARAYCQRLIGIAGGRVAFDGAPGLLTNAAARRLYGIEADDAIDDSATPEPSPGRTLQWSGAAVA